MDPDDRKYTTSHEWVKIEGNVAVIGITDYAQKALGDVTWVELPKVSRKLRQSEDFAELESVKTAGQVYTPVSGEIVSINANLIDDPSSINKDPYGEGWLIKVSGFQPEQAEGLMDSKDYVRLVQVEK